MPSQNVKVIASIIITAVIVGGGVYFFEKNKNTPAPIKTAVPDISTTTVSPTSTPTSTEKIIDQKNSADQEIILLSPDATPETAESCMKGYLNGQFTLLVRNATTKQAIDRADLGRLFLSPAPLRIQEAMRHGKKTYFVSVQQYGTCNGDLFNMFALPTVATPKIRAVSFSDSMDNAIFAERKNGPTFAGGTSGDSFLAVDYYDNTVGTMKTLTYDWDGDVGFTNK